MKRLLILVIIIMLMTTLPISAMAISQRSVLIAPELTIEGETATCDVKVTTGTPNSKIIAVVKLWNGNVCIHTWTSNGSGYLFFNESHSVTKGITYTMTVDITIDGVTQPQITKSATCS